MPKVYRSMKKDDLDKPMVDSTGRGLGVRGSAVNGRVDVDLDASGRVVLNRKGMSVAPRWRDLPFFLVPKRLRHKFPAARGSSELYCFTMGDGAFRDGVLAEGLELVVDRQTHGCVVPRALVPLDEFQAAIASTRAAWSIDEE